MAFINRYSDTIRGALTFTGNTAGLSKLANANSAGTVASIGAFTSLNGALQVSDFPAGTTLNIAENGSNAQLVIPAGSNIVYAELIWGGNYYGQNGNDGTIVDISGQINNPVRLTTSNGANSVNPDPATAQQQSRTFTIPPGTGIFGFGFYERSQDVTALIQPLGAGTHTISVEEIPGLTVPVDATTSGTNHAGWTLAVAYQNSTFTYRNLNIWVGAELVDRQTSSTVDVPISGFLTPASGAFNARLLVSVQEGDATAGGDQLLFGPDSSTLTALSGPNNPVNNFFGSQINNDSGNLDTTGTFGNRNQDPFTQTNIAAGRQGWDITNVDVSAEMTNNQTAAVVRFFTTATTGEVGESYMPDALGLQIDSAMPNIVIDKARDKAVVVLGDTITYTLNITNNGTLATDNFTLTDPAPTGTTVNTGSIIVIGATGPVVDNSTPSGLNIDLGPINIGQTVTVTYTVTTTGTTPSPILNSATGAFTFTPVPGEVIPESAASNQVSTETVNVTQSKAVSKTQAAVGDVITYTVTIDNSTGTAPLNNVFVFDNLQAETSYVLNSTVIGNGVPFNSDPSIPPGIPVGVVPAGAIQTVSFDVRIDSLPNPQTVNNTADVTFDVGNTPVTQPTNQTTVNIVDLTVGVNKSVDKPLAQVGDKLTYTVVITNNSDVPIDNLIFNDSPPANTTYDGSGVTINGNLYPALNPNSPIDLLAVPVVPNPFPLQPGQSVTISYTVDVTSAPPSGKIDNTADVTAQFTVGGQPVRTTTTSNIATTEIYQLNLVKTVDKTAAEPGDILTYTTTITSTTPGTYANDIIFIDNLPAGTTLVPGSIGVVGASIVTDNSTATQVNLNLGPNFPNTPIVVTFKVTIATGATGQLVNTSTVNIGTTTTESNPVTTTIVNPGVRKDSSVNFATVGQIYTYTVTIDNTGSNVPLTNVFVYDPLQSGTSYVPNTTQINGGLPTNQDPSVAPGINVGTVPANTVTTVTFNVKVDTLPIPNPILNTATVNYQLDGVDKSVDTNQTSVDVLLADLVASKSVDKAFANVGDEITYTINLVNNGNAPANSVVITDPVPSGTSYVPGSISSTAAFTGTPLTTINLNNPIAPAGSVTITYKVHVDQIPTPNPIPNSADINYSYIVDPAGQPVPANTTTNQVTTQVNNGNLTVVKSVNKAFADVGDTLTYTLVITNAGNTPVSSVKITDPVPNGTSYVGGSTTATVPFTGDPTSTINLSNPLAPGASVTVTYQVTVDQIPTPNPIPNTAVVDYLYQVDPTLPPVAGTNTSNEVTTQVNHADLLAPGNFVKAVDKAFANVGDEITYTITVKNTGNTTANNVVIADPVPAGTSYVAGSINSTAPFTGTPPATINLTNPIPPNGTVTITFRVKVDQIPDPNPIPNSADVNYAYTVDPAITNGATASGTTNTVTTQVNNGNLQVDKATDKQFADVGNDITYTVTIKNIGNVPVSSIKITDPIPAGTSYVAGSTVASVPFTGDPTSTINLTNPLAPGSTVTVTYKVNVNQIPTPNPIPNTAVVDYVYQVDPNGPQIPGTNTTNQVNTQVNHADLVAPGNFVKAADKTFANVGDEITYTITVKNTGNTPANNVVISDPVPNGTSYVPGSIISTAPFTGTPPGTINLTNPIPPNGTVTITFRVKVDQIPTPNPIPNMAAVNYAYTVDPNVPNGATASGNTNIVNTQVNNGSLNIVKQVDKAYANVGDVLTYTITATNSGNVMVSNIVLTDPIPAGTSYVENSTNANVLFTGDPTTTIKLTNPLAPGASAIITFKVNVDTIPTPNPIPNTAKMDYTYVVDPNGPPIAGTNNSNLVNTQVNHADLLAPGNFVKSVDKAYADVGEIITYTITVKNTGNVSANNVVITDPVPIGTSYVAGSITSTVAFTGTPPANINLTNPIPANGTATITFKVKVDQIPNPNPIPNQANITYQYTVDPAVPNGVTQTGATNIVTTEVRDANLTDPGNFVKSVDKQYVDTNEVITYTLTLHNTGNVAAENVLVTDPIPQGTNYVADSLTINGASSGDNPETGIHVGSVGPGETVIIVFKVKVGPNIPNPNPIPNQAMLVYTYVVDPANPPISETAHTNIVNTLVQTADLVTPGNVTKTANKSLTAPGDTITYTVTVRNTGNIAANNVVVADQVPEGTVFIPGTVTIDNVSKPNQDPSLGIQVGDVAAGATKVITFQVKVGENPPTPITNTATVSYTYTPDPNRPPVIAPPVVTPPVNITPLFPNVEMTKSANLTGAVVGDTITYTIVVKNTGQLAAENLTVKDPLTTDVAYANNLKLNGSPIAGDITAGVNIGTLGVGQIATLTFDVKVLSQPTNSTNTVDNMATASYQYRANPTDQPLPATSESNEVSVRIYRPELTVLKQADRPSVVVGIPFTYHIVVQNTGDIAIDNGIVKDNLPIGFVVQQILLDGVIITGNLATGINIGRLEVGQQRVLDVTIIPSNNVAIANFNNIAQVDGTAKVDPNQPPKPVSGTGRDTQGVKVYDPELKLTKSANKSYAIIGDTVTYTIVATNVANPLLNNIPLINVIISDLLAEELEFVEGSVTVNGNPLPSESILSGVNIGTLAVGQSKSITFEAKIISDLTNPVENIALGRFSYEVPGVPITDVETESNRYFVNIERAEVSVEKVATPELVVLGDIITYTARIKNIGTVIAYNVLFSDILPKEVELIPGTLTVDGQVLHGVDLAKGVIIGNLAIGEEVTIQYQVKVTGSNCKGVIANAAHVIFDYRLPDGTTGTKEGVPVHAGANIAQVQVALTNFKQTSIEAYLEIPCQKPNMEGINGAKGKIDITDCHVITTMDKTSSEGQRLTGYKLIVSGQLTLVIEYTALDGPQSVHSAHYTMPFSTFIVLPPSYQVGSKIEVEGLIEDIYTKALDCRSFFSNTTILVYAKLLGC